MQIHITNQIWLTKVGWGVEETEKQLQMIKQTGVAMYTDLL